MFQLKMLLAQACLREKGQATIEYVLMLSTVVVLFSAFITAFHHDIVKWFFMFVGELVTPHG